MKYKIRTTIVMCLLILCVSGCDMRQEEKTVKENPETATISIENGKEEITKLSYPKKQYTEFENKMGEDRSEYAKPISEGNSLGHSIMGKDGLVETEGVYHLKSGEEFERFIQIGNFLGEDLDFKLLVFNNCEQIEFDVDGKRQSVCDVYIKENEKLPIPVTLSSFHKGLNDIIFLIVCDSDINLTSDERIDTYDFNTVYLRCTIYVDDESIPEFQPVDVQGEAAEDITDFMLHEEKEEVNKIFTGKSLKKNEEMDYYLTVGNAEEEDMDFALLLLEDWEQKPLDGEMKKIIHMSAGTQITIPLKASFKEEGVHEITVLKIASIYKEYDPESGVEVESSTRLGMEVK